MTDEIAIDRISEGCKLIKKKQKKQAKYVYDWEGKVINVELCKR